MSQHAIHTPIGPINDMAPVVVNDDDDYCDECGAGGSNRYGCVCSDESTADFGWSKRNMRIARAVREYGAETTGEY